MDVDEGTDTRTALPFRVILRMEVRAELAQQFEQVWLEVGALIAEEPANLAQALVRSVEEQGVYYVITDWRSKAQFHTFEHSAAHVEHRRRLKPFRTGGGMSLTEVVYQLPGAGAALARA
ncbi:antibiotic biosynthesis monooxygenase [Streptacidiphilus sp. PB12-B1b]|uniref:antibiotic biosynthesis monooxygenase family protein n=1 Tax=Streptacidiphilus sp. PB12-B1b TaxID=2705012 RepID=UPI0015FD918B|nr:antibiotic biosynthesis monooxygenase family protein [Streptacidiphilus sp. PB12-B1b]QMU78161.1 antibiotic biosynthesis monooxygenase [Streptacidiphilus sp. PB12-B1b]